MKCLTCGKELPEYAKIINKEYCSQECESKSKIDLPPGFEQLFSNLNNNA